MTNFSLDDIYDTVAIAHMGQKRKDGSLYIEHPHQVKKALVTWGVIDKDILAAALLHDVVEDTLLNLTDVEKVSNKRVAGIVNELTLVYNTPEEKQQLIDNFSSKSTEAIMIKVADRICNSLDFIKIDPEYAVSYWVKGTGIITAFLLKSLNADVLYGQATKEIFDNIQKCITKTDKTMCHLHALNNQIYVLNKMIGR